MLDDETLDDPDSRVPAAVPRTNATTERFLVLSELGRGGMGVVERAYDTQLQREVALKRVHGEGLDDRRRARLLHEARTMARLSHPNVVQVYDILSGEHGELLIAMEYVRGGTLAEWMERGQEPARMLEMLVAAGHGLAAAHAAGLIHRDFKPANVLVGTDGRPRVTDFGLAQPSDGQGNELAVVSSRAGSPAYMAPEQADGEVSLAADQFAFCVATWQALTGELPFPGGRTAMLLAKADGPPTFPAELGLPREVGLALQHGLSPRPEDRFESMDALLEALLPPPPRASRSLAMLQVGVVLAVLVGTLLGIREVQARRCTGARQALAETWGGKRAQAVQAALQEAGDAALLAPTLGERLQSWAVSWETGHTEACQAHTVRREQSAALMDTRMACLDQARQRLDVQLEVLVTTSAEARADVAGALLHELPNVEVCGDLQALAKGTSVASAELRRAATPLLTELARGRTLLDALRFGEAEEVLQQVRPGVRQVQYAPLSLEFQILEGALLLEAGRHQDARRILEEGLAGALALERWDLALSVLHRLVMLHAEGLKDPDAAASLLAVGQGLAGHSVDPAAQRERLAFDAGVLRESQGDLSGSVAAFEEALSVRTQRLGEGAALASAQANLAALLTEAGELERALELHDLALNSARDTLGESALKTLLMRSGRAVALTRARRVDEALAELTDVEGRLTAQLGEHHHDVRTMWEALSDALLAADRPSDALEPSQRALTSALSTLGEHHVDTAGARSHHAKVLAHAGQDEAAVEMYRAAAASMGAALGPRHHRVAGIRLNLGTTLADLGRSSEAEQAFLEARDIWAEVHGEDSYFVGLADFNLGELAHEHGDAAEARSRWEYARKAFAGRLAADHPWVRALARRLDSE